MDTFDLKTPPHKLVKEIDRMHKKVESLDSFYQWTVNKDEPYVKNLNQTIQMQADWINSLRNENNDLKLEIARLKKTSRTSSKPPSSEIIKARNENDSCKTKRKKGAQYGHKKHDRPAIPKDEIDETIEFPLNYCSSCESIFSKEDLKEEVIQQIEILDKPIKISEYRGYSKRCNDCGIFNNSIPKKISLANLSGPKLTSFIAYLKGSCHCSITTIEKFLRDVLKIKFSRGYISKLVMKVSAALERPYEEIENKIWAENKIHIDETGHKNNGKHMWNWCYKADDFTFFKIMDSRSYNALASVLTDSYEGTIISDYYGAYRKYVRLHGNNIQYCLAHLIRDIRFLTTLPDEEAVKYGERLLDHLKNIFRIKNTEQSSTVRESKLDKCKKKFLNCAQKSIPEENSSQNISKRLLKDGEQYFSFVSDNAIEPTNNLAEQAIRYVVIDRKVTQGTRSQKGINWSERIWTIRATCHSQGKSEYDFLSLAMNKMFCNKNPPSLVSS